MSILSVKNIKKSYGKHRVLDDVSLEITQPKMIALVGPNGSGKTTLLNIIANLLNADSGSVEILGKSNKDISVYNRYSYMMDNTVLYPYLTGLDHMKFVAETHRLDRTAVRKTAECVGIKHFLNKKTSDYSLGMKQQLIFAMSIINEPDLLVLDEPFNGLDPSNIIRVRNILKEYRKAGKAILLSSHNLSEVDQMTSHIVFVKDGKLIEEDISAFQKNRVYLKLKHIEEHRDKLESLHLSIQGDEVVINQNRTDFAALLSQIASIGQIVRIRTEVRGAEKRYEELLEQRR